MNTYKDPVGQYVGNMLGFGTMFLFEHFLLGQIAMRSSFLKVLLKQKWLGFRGSSTFVALHICTFTYCIRLHVWLCEAVMNAYYLYKDVVEPSFPLIVAGLFNFLFVQFTNGVLYPLCRH